MVSGCQKGARGFRVWVSVGFMVLRFVGSGVSMGFREVSGGFVVLVISRI